MKLPLRWLKEYVDYRVTNEEFVERMMWRGFEVAAIEPELPGAEDVIVGRVESVARHENSDHLYVCRVNTGECDASTSSTRNTRPGMTSRNGGFTPLSARISHGEVCVRSTTFSLM